MGWISMNYDDFLHSKQRIPPACGFDILEAST